MSAIDKLARSARTVALGGLVAGLTPVWAVRTAVDRARSVQRRTAMGPAASGRSGSAPAATEIERADVADVDLAKVVDRNAPLIISGLDSLIPFTHRPDLAGMRQLAALDHSTFQVRVHKSHSPYFLYVGDYGSELDHERQMSLDTFLDHMFTGDPDPDTCTYRLFGISTLNGRVAGVIGEMAETLGALTGRAPDPKASGIWIGSAGVVTPMHHDAWTGILFQFEGSKRVSLFSPSDRPNLHLSSPFKPTSRWSRLPPRSHEASPEEFPRFALARPHVGTLRAGEALYIPPYWMHEVEALEPNISIPFRFGTRINDYVNPGFLRPAVEVLHSKYAGRGASA